MALVQQAPPNNETYNYQSKSLAIMGAIWKFEIKIKWFHLQTPPLKVLNARY